jgi:hypothetical protein
MGHSGRGRAARHLGRPAWQAGPALALVLAAAGCTSAVDTWRSLNGTDINDPNPKTAPFTGNMAEAFQRPYPNLASVPPPPTDETSTAERNKLAQTLVADRGATAALGAPPPGTPAPPASPASRVPAASARPTRLASNSPAAGGNPAAARQPGEPPEAQPLNSSLLMPSIAAPLPQPQAPQPPPPTPRLAALPPTPPPAPLAAPAAASAIPQPAPQQPVLALIPPPAAAKPPPKPKPTVATVATFDIGDSAARDASDRVQLARVAALYKQRPGMVKVVAFAAAPPPGGDPLEPYHAALDRAQGIARQLAADGIPSAKIQTEATPASGAQIGRIEIQFAP